MTLQTETFGGFTKEDFAVFDVPDFAERMPLLRATVKPKLTLIGEALTESLSKAMGEPLFPHVAQHLRRTVNPPEVTWVAFSRSPRAYKPFVHLRVAISVDKVRVLAFVEDYADDKALFAANLECNAEAIAAHCAKKPALHAYEILDAKGKPLHGVALTAETLRAFAEKMQRVKGQHAVFGVPFAKTKPVLAAGPEFLEAVIKAAKVLKPFYHLGL